MELELYLHENDVDILACNETYLNQKRSFSITGYDIIRNDRSDGRGGGVAFLVKSEIIINKQFDNNDFNIITDNEALAIEVELANGRNITLATIYCPNGRPNEKLFTKINGLSDRVIFLGDFNSKHKMFGCAKQNQSGPILKGIVKKLNLYYLNNKEHTHWDNYGTTDILDMAFISPSLQSQDFYFAVGDDVGSDHLPIEIVFNKPLPRNIARRSPRYQLEKADLAVFTSTIRKELGAGNFDLANPKNASDLDKLQGEGFDAFMKAVNISIPLAEDRPDKKPKVSKETDRR